MRILSAGLWPRSFFHVELELIQKHLNAGDEVDLVTCNSQMLPCETNAEMETSACMWCIGTREKGLELLEGKVKTLPVINLTREQAKEVDEYPLNFADFTELKALMFENFDVGMSAASGLITLTGYRNPPVDEFREVLIARMRVAMAIFRTTQNHLRKVRYDRVYINNGRTPSARALVRACESVQTPYSTFELGRSWSEYKLFPNGRLHDHLLVRRLAREHWEKHAGDPERDEMAHSFYTGRMAHKPAFARYVFTNGMRQGELPSGWDHSVHNIVIFLNTEDELEAISHVPRLKFSRNQIGTLRPLLEQLNQAEGRKHVYIRSHPNMFGTLINSTKPRPREQWEELLTLEGTPNLTIIPPDSPIDSYALMAAANVVAAFLSTTGIEAAYQGKPVVILGTPVYGELGSTYEPETLEEAVRLLMTPDLPPLPMEGALIAGYFYHTYGEKCEFGSANSMETRKFKGVALEPTRKWQALLEGGSRVPVLWRLVRKGRGRAVQNWMQKFLLTMLRRPYRYPQGSGLKTPSPQGR